MWRGILGKRELTEKDGHKVFWKGSKIQGIKRLMVFYTRSEINQIKDCSFVFGPSKGQSERVLFRAFWEGV